MKNHYICGGGIAGLCAAFFLLENKVPGNNIFIYDNNDVFGGLVDVDTTNDKGIFYDTHFNRKYGIDTYTNIKYIFSKLMFDTSDSVWQKITKDGISNNTYGYIVNVEDSSPYIVQNAGFKEISSIFLFLLYYIFYNNSSIPFGDMVPECLRKSAVYQNIQINGGFLDSDSASNWLSLFIYGVDEFVRVGINGYVLFIIPLTTYLKEKGVNLISNTEMVDIKFTSNSVSSIIFNDNTIIDTRKSNVLLTVSAKSINTGVIEKLFEKNIIGLNKSRIDNPDDKWCYFRLTTNNEYFINLINTTYPLAIKNMEDIVLVRDGILLGLIIFMNGSYFDSKDTTHICMTVILPSINMAKSLVSSKELNSDVFFDWTVSFFKIENIMEQFKEESNYEFEFDDGVSDRLYRNNTTTDYIKPYNLQYKNLVFIGQYVKSDYRFNLTMESVAETSKHAVEKLIYKKRYNG